MDDVAPPAARRERRATPEGVPAGIYRDAVVSLLRLALGFAVFMGVIALAAWGFRAELERLGHWFIERFGVGGMMVGTFLADGFHFPIPPQFYLLTGVTGGGNHAATVLGVLTGSIAGGLAAFAAGRWASKIAWINRRARAPRALLRGLFDRHGNWGLVIAGLLPLSYWLLCSLGGVLKLPYSSYGVIALMRVPRILVSYALIVVAWGAAPS